MRTSCLDLEEYGFLRFVSHREIGAEGVEEVSLEHDLCEGLIIQGSPICVCLDHIENQVLEAASRARLPL